MDVFAKAQNWAVKVSINSTNLNFTKNMSLTGIFVVTLEWNSVNKHSMTVTFLLCGCIEKIHDCLELESENIGS